MLGAMVFWFLFQAFNTVPAAGGVGDGLLPALPDGGGATGAVALIAAVGLALMLLMIFRPQGLLGTDGR